MAFANKVKNINLISTTIPVFIATLISTISAPINTFIVSGVNQNAVEGVGSASSILMLFGVLVSLVAGGSTILVGQYIGAKGNELELKRATHSTFWLMLMMGLFISVFLVALAKVLLKAWGLTSGLMLSQGLIYIYSIAPTFILIVLQQFFLGTLAIYGYPKSGTYVGLLVTFLDILISALLIYIVKMNIWGVIIGTIVARLCGTILAAWIYSLKLAPFWQMGSFNWTTAWKLVKISLPIAFEKANYNATMFVLGILIGQIGMKLNLVQYGHNYMIWARAIFNALTAIVMIGGVSLSIGLERVLSRLYGSGKYQKSNKIVYQAFSLACLIDLPLTIIIFLIQAPLINWLTASESNLEAINFLKEILYPTLGWLILLEFGRINNLIFIAATRSAGDTKFTAYVAITTSWITNILLGWILADVAKLGWQGIMLAMTIDECLRGLINFMRWKLMPQAKFIKKISGNIGQNKNILTNEKLTTKPIFLVKRKNKQNKESEWK